MANNDVRTFSLRLRSDNKADKELIDFLDGQTKWIQTMKYLLRHAQTQIGNSDLLEQALFGANTQPDFKINQSKIAETKVNENIPVREESSQNSQHDNVPKNDSLSNEESEVNPFGAKETPKKEIDEQSYRDFM